MQQLESRRREVGEDEDGELLLAEIRRRGIDGSFLRRSATAPTSYSEVMSGGGKRTFFHCRGANAELEADELAAINVPARFFYLGYLLLLDRLDAADPEYGTRAARLLAGMRARGYRTVVDFVSEAPEKFRKTVLPALPHIDVLIINEIEAGCCLGESVREDDGTLIPPQGRRRRRRRRSRRRRRWGAQRARLYYPQWWSGRLWRERRLWRYRWHRWHRWHRRHRRHRWQWRGRHCIVSPGHTGVFRHD